MKKKKIWVTICVVIFAVGIIGSVWLLCKPHGQTVNIIQDGEILYTIDLERTEDKTIVVEYQGRKNSIQIQDHQIFVAEADCPDHTCIKMGKLQSAAAPIICLPNKLVIAFAGKSDIDAEVR